MNQLIRHPGSEFATGRTEITRLDDVDEPTGIGLAVIRLGAGEHIALTAAGESAWLLMNGALEAAAGGRTVRWSRQSLFDDRPSCLHVAAGERVALTATSPVELTEYSVKNTVSLAPQFFGPADVQNEPRGKGQVGDACLRFVRTIFDDANTEGAAQLVLGEVVNFPGRWSSYPPHHHPQPEIYHYRFTHPQGYGHAELGDQVLKVRQGDTVRILNGQDHAQVAAPGYGMYYSWVIRHLPGQRYLQPEFTAEHVWTMAPGAEHWHPEKEVG